MASGGISHDGSGKTDRLAMWNPPLRSADADTLPRKSKTDARTRDLVQSDAYLAGGTNTIKDSVVGAYYRPSPQPETKVLFGKEDDTWESEFQEEVAVKFTLYAESSRNWVDASRRLTLTGLVRLAMSQFMLGGEVLGTSEWFNPNRSARPFGSAVQIIDPDRLSDPLDQLDVMRQRRIRRGVERNSVGAPIAYWIRNAHPSDTRFYDPDYESSRKWSRVPREKPWGRQMVLHVFDQDRADQSRAVSPLATALQEMRMLQHFRTTELQRATIAATYAASIESDLPDDVLQALGTNAAGDGNPTTQWMLDYLKALVDYSGGANNMHMDGAQIPIFVPGTHLKIQNPGAQSPLGSSFEQSALRNMAAALNISYEQLSKDYTATNYSSARAALSETNKSLAVKKRMIADAIANFIYRGWLEEAINTNQIECLKRKNVPNFYDGLNAEAYAKCEWIGAGQGQIDPLKETQASILKVKAGLSTKEAEIARLSGSDYRIVARQIKRERELDTYYGNPSVYDQDSKDMENSLTAEPRDGAKK